MVQPNEDRLDASIHMLFMQFNIAVIWLDHDFRVVDTRLALRWRLAYFPTCAAKHVLEIHPDRIRDFHLNDYIRVEPCENSLPV